MRDANIVCFAKEWSEDPTSNNHVMRLLAAENTVLWLNSIATRTPSLTSSRDLGKIKRKLMTIGEAPREVSRGLHVVTPLVLPFPHSCAAMLANRQILRATLAPLRRRLGMAPFQLWSFLPTAAPYVGTLGEELSVYYCTDEWSQFSYVDREKTVAHERAMLATVDVVFTTSRSLYESKKPFNRETHLASHGVDHAHFATALDDATPIAKELVGRTGPVIGFFGLVQDWIDLDLFAYLAAQRPAWTIAIVGRALVPVGSLHRYPNIVLVDRRPYSDLPSYCKAFDVALCPFKVNELTVHVNPIKLREYVSAGLPVVSTDIPECRLSPELTRVGTTHAEVLAQIERALHEGSPEARRARSAAMTSETWEIRVAALGETIERVRAEKQKKKGTRER